VASVGSYDRRIVILPRVLAAASAGGEEVESWPESGAVTWAAAVEGLSGSEQVASAIRRTTGAVKLRLPGRAPIVAADRLRFKEETGGPPYGVDGVYFETANWETVVSASVAVPA
jgi:head-tail adaptor